MYHLDTPLFGNLQLGPVDRQLTSHLTVIRENPISTNFFVGSTIAPIQYYRELGEHRTGAELSTTSKTCLYLTHLTIQRVLRNFPLGKAAGNSS
jgi:hypothetical protein